MTGMTIDERLEALTMNLELVSRDIEALRELATAYEEREKRGRAAILQAIRAYLEALG